MQRDALLIALLEILRLIAEKSKVVMVLPSPDDECFVDHSATYFHDGITEKVHFFSLYAIKPYVIAWFSSFIFFTLVVYFLFKS